MTDEDYTDETFSSAKLNEDIGLKLTNLLIGTLDDLDWDDLDPFVQSVAKYFESAARQAGAQGYFISGKTISFSVVSAEDPMDTLVDFVDVPLTDVAIASMDLATSAAGSAADARESRDSMIAGLQAAIDTLRAYPIADDTD